MSKIDPGIEWIREVRHRISEEHDHDPQKLVNYYMELQKQYQHRLLEKEDEQPVEPINA
jgi:hypothetical protein